MSLQLTTPASCVVELHKHGDAHQSDDETFSRRSTACSRSTSQTSRSSRSSGSQTKFTRRFVWADVEDSDDDADVTPSSVGSNGPSPSGGNPCIPPGCHQPLQLGGVQPSTPCVPPGCNQHFSQAFVAYSPVVYFVQPFQGQLPGVGLSNTCTEPLAPEQDSRTMLVLKNLPAGCMQDGVCKILEDAGLAGLYNFLYVPINLKGFVPLQYAFVNFECNEDAVKAFATLDGLEKTYKVAWSDTQQDLQGHIERYRNSPLMHDSVPEEYRPVLFKNGVRIPFPAPTQRVKAPKLRPAQQA